MKIGLVLNPLAGLGGEVALKGSDGMSKLAKDRGSRSQVSARVKTCLNEVLPWVEGMSMVTYPGQMGGDLCADLGIPREIIGSIGDVTRASDTKNAVRAFADLGVDLILFAGGDGTARDVYDSVPVGQVVLGIPCGVKMHSGVFAINPQSAGKIVRSLISGKLVSAMDAEVRDVDEASLRSGEVKSKYYGQLCVPAELTYIQATKSGGKEVEALAVQEIVADIIEHMEPETTYVVGSGSTTEALMGALSINNTLLGIDAIRGNKLLGSDLTEEQLYKLVSESSDIRLVITVIGGQGHLFGRGNQQLSPRVIRAVGLDNIVVIATKTKLEGLNGRPLIVDTGDISLDEALCGLRRVVTGYEDSVLLRVSG